MFPTPAFSPIFQEVNTTLPHSPSNVDTPWYYWKWYYGFVSVRTFEVKDRRPFQFLGMVRECWTWRRVDLGKELGMIVDGGVLWSWEFFWGIGEYTADLKWMRGKAEWWSACGCDGGESIDLRCCCAEFKMQWLQLYNTKTRRVEMTFVWKFWQNIKL